jgi:hypothetical protein
VAYDDRRAHDQVASFAVLDEGGQKLRDLDADGGGREAVADHELYVGGMQAQRGERPAGLVGESSAEVGAAQVFLQRVGPGLRRERRLGAVAEVEVFGQWSLDGVTRGGVVGTEGE